MKIIGRLHPQLSTEEPCSHQYKLPYIDKIGVGEDGVEAFMGSTGRNALEKLHRHLDVNADRQLAFYQMGVVVPLDLNQISV
jgi:hypothetical protein